VIYFVPDRYAGEFREIRRILKSNQPLRPLPLQGSVSEAAVLNSVSSTGCPYPRDIDPNLMDSKIPAQARIGGAAAAFSARLRLCQQGRGSEVPGGCASVCYAESPATPPISQPTAVACTALPRPESRFGVGDINQADPPLLVTAKVLQGWDDCEKVKLRTQWSMLRMAFALQKYRGLQTIMTGYGYVASIQTLVADIDALRQPGESLAGAAYRVGQLLCDGVDLRTVLGKVVNRDTVARFLPKNPKPQKIVPPSPVRVLANGITPLDDLALQGFARDNNVILIIRNSNVFAARWVGYPGAAAKPMALKAKSLSPPANAENLTAAQRADEARYAPYYGLASARGLSVVERNAITKSGYVIQPQCNGEIITTRSGGVIYSDIDVHGIYDSNGKWAGSNAALKTLNKTTLGRFVQHQSQDDFAKRNDPNGPSFGPQPPATAYGPNGRMPLDTMEEMKTYYDANRIDWHAIYPHPLASYRAASGKP
jgi:hypothetical protein